ncbi:hypothetical protein CFC21_035940 [Triticum aestivum]|uniref:Uncharacterized protein n=3 Tax=Triticum TaxID=4564 RepID=A0A9R0RN35_TRITD|nr:hypothetical protein CFC21_035940 [Triticum aestivum]VAH63207.1 unnamed protein product [Triticum turgidum subsp. durum]
MRRPVRACGGELRRYGPRYMYISLSLSLSLFSRHLLTSYCSSSENILPSSCFVCGSSFFFRLYPEAVSDAFLAWRSSFVMLGTSMCLVNVLLSLECIGYTL